MCRVLFRRSRPNTGHIPKINLFGFDLSYLFFAKKHETLLIFSAQGLKVNSLIGDVTNSTHSELLMALCGIF